MTVKNCVFITIVLKILDEQTAALWPRLWWSSTAHSVLGNWTLFVVPKPRQAHFSYKMFALPVAFAWNIFHTDLYIGLILSHNSDLYPRDLFEVASQTMKMTLLLLYLLSKPYHYIKWCFCLFVFFLSTFVGEQALSFLTYSPTSLIEPDTQLALNKYLSNEWIAEWAPITEQ